MKGWEGRITTRAICSPRIGDNDGSVRSCGAFCTAAAQHYVASVASSPPWTVERDARRAPDILVNGPPKSGKTTFTRYLEQEYVVGIVNMGECVEMARALQAYRGHALVIWDFPKSFEWHLHKSRETFSEFASYRRSTMYRGDRVQLCNHVLVFANINPIENISHRRIQHYSLDEILTDSEEVAEAAAEAAVAPDQSGLSSQASTLMMGPFFDPLSGSIRQMATGRSESPAARSRSR